MQAVALHMLPTNYNVVEEEKTSVYFYLQSSPDCNKLGLRLITPNSSTYNDAFEYRIGGDSSSQWNNYQKDQVLYYINKEDGTSNQIIELRAKKDLHTLSTYETVTDPETNEPKIVLQGSSYMALVGDAGNDVLISVAGDMESLVHSGGKYYKNPLTGEKIRKPFNPGIYAKFFSKDTYFRDALKDVSGLVLLSDLPVNEEGISDFGLPDYAFAETFAYCKKIQKEPIIAWGGIREIGNYGCYEMFYYCTSIKEAAVGCSPYSVGEFALGHMCAYCSSLTDTTSSLPAKTLAPHCYRNLFQECTALSNMPSLDFTDIKDAPYCCYWMFESCYNLSGSVTLKPEELPMFAYASMFSNCVKIDTVKVSFKKWYGNATSSWLNNVAKEGTFRCPRELCTIEVNDNGETIIYINRGSDFCPMGWEVQIN